LARISRQPAWPCQQRGDLDAAPSARKRVSGPRLARRPRATSGLTALASATPDRFIDFRTSRCWHILTSPWTAARWQRGLSHAAVPPRPGGRPVPEPATLTLPPSAGLGDRRAALRSGRVRRAEARRDVIQR
jgi:hypothetical protein